MKFLITTTGELINVNFIRNISTPKSKTGKAIVVMDNNDEHEISAVEYHHLCDVCAPHAITF